ncbi:MAG: hypothetical protein MUF62_04675 [Chitinophagaceae bacterium]|nr:hypothetical protein [Chitinophagaceae bacterium]
MLTCAWLLPMAGTAQWARYSPQWSAALHQKGNTAAGCRYLQPVEKQLVQQLNMLRQQPALFARTVLVSYLNAEKPDWRQNWYYKSLYDTLLVLKPQPLLLPDSLCWVSARCHAISSGQAGYVGHQRLSNECQRLLHYHAECCHYGYSQPLAILVSLLVDEDIPDLGHRRILLSPYTKVGVAFAPHAQYNYNTVFNLAN